MTSTMSFQSRSLSTNSLISLPIECRQAILAQVSDISTLQAVILSHSSLYEAFCNRKRFIIESVLYNLISYELLPEALSVLDSSRVEPWTREKVHDILARHSSHQIPVSFQFTISDALRIQEFHRTVKFFTTNFAETALSQHPLTGIAERPSAPLSPGEWRRIASSFYRFELCTNFFRKRDQRRQKVKDSPDFDIDEQWDIFYKRYSVWEIEQLACVGEYLFRELSRPFNEVAAHDVKWGAHEVYYADIDAWEGGPSFQKNHFLDCGLVFLHRVVAAETYEDRYRLFQSRYGSVAWSLPDNLYLLNPSEEDDDKILLEDYRSDELAAALGTPFVEDLDPGPTEAWRWTHSQMTRTYFISSLYHANLRKRGYVMWDHARLVNWGFFESVWKNPGPPDNTEFLRRKDAMEKSWAQRKRLFKKGAEGWWSEDDDTRLSWRKIEWSSDDEDD